MHAGLSPQSIDSIDGFALATPYFCSARSYTVGDGLGAWHFMGTGMPADTNPATARQKLQDCTTYPNALNLTTMLAALPKAQFAIPEVNLDAANPGVFADLQRMVDLMISKGIVPIILTYTYRTDAAFNLLVDQYNTALVAYAQAKKLPLIDLNKEMLARLPFAQWPGRFLSDGVHYTRGTTPYPATGDPYANGGDPATHTTGLALTYNGYGLKGWLGVQKMKEIKQLVVDGVSPTLPTVTLSASPASIASGAASTLTWSSTNATTVSINQGIGTVTASGTRSVSPTATTTYTVTATNAAGSVTATATVTVTTVPTVTLSASPSSITSGASSTLTWSSTNATMVSINQGIGAVALSGTVSVSPTATTTYTVTATNTVGSVTATAAVTVTAAGSAPLLQQSDLVYEGAFRLPAGPNDQNTLAYGGFGMAYNPARNSLYMNGHLYYQKTAEVSIPPITNSTSLSALSTATLLQPLTDITEGRLSSVGAGKVYIGGQMVHGGRLIGSAYTQDDTSQVASHFASGLTLSTLNDFQGFYQVGTIGARFVSGYMTAIPPEWQTALGGKALTGGCCNPPNLGATNIAGMPWGPAAFVFNPDDRGHGHAGAGDPGSVLLAKSSDAGDLEQYDHGEPGVQPDDRSDGGRLSAGQSECALLRQDRHERAVLRERDGGSRAASAAVAGRRRGRGLLLRSERGERRRRPARVSVCVLRVGV